MEEVRQGEGKVREKEGGKERRGGGYPLSGAPCGGNGGHTGTVEGEERGRISRRPHDLFRPGGTCASQPLMAAPLHPPPPNLCQPTGA